MSPVYAKHCRYCRRELTTEKGATIDHVIPRWVMRLFTHKPFAKPRKGFHQRNRVTACHGCNRRKGSMPVTIFLSLRLDNTGLLKKERSRWDRISNELQKFARDSLGGRLAIPDHPLAPMVLAEFLKPIPEHFVTGTRPISVKYAEGQGPDFVRGG